MRLRIAVVVAVVLALTASTIAVAQEQRCGPGPRWLLVTVEQTNVVDRHTGETKGTLPDLFNGPQLLDLCKVAAVAAVGDTAHDRTLITTLNDSEATFLTLVRVRESLVQICAALPTCVAATPALVSDGEGFR